MRCRECGEFESKLVPVLLGQKVEGLKCRSCGTITLSDGRIPVRYVGLQEGFTAEGVPDFHLVDDPSGSTKAFDPAKHLIIGLSASAERRGAVIPKELVPYYEPLSQS